MKELFIRFWPLIILGAIMIGSFGLKAYKHHDWLYFRGDQARDATLVKYAVDHGPGFLPLLGPKAGGTSLRLGPIFYYFQYAAAQLSGSTDASVMAYPDLLFSMLMIPLLYYFSRQFLSQGASITVAALAGFSFILVQYGRFAWNPNSIPFWSLLLITAVYKTTIAESKTGWWLMLAGLSYGVVSQLHFVALLGFPFVVIGFWALYRPYGINWKYWMGAVLLVGALYAPFLISESITNWGNTQQFLYAVTHKAKPRTMLMSLQEFIPMFGRQYTLFITGTEQKNDALTTSLAFGYIALLVGLLFWGWFSKKDRPFRAWIWLLLVWFGIYFVLYTKLVDSMEEPRFWFMTAAVPFVLVGMVVEKIIQLPIPLKRIVAGCLVVGLIGSNGYSIYRWGAGLRTTEKRFQYFPRLALKQSDGYTMAHMETIVSFMKQYADRQGRGACYRALRAYSSSFEYVFDQQYPGVYEKRSRFKSEAEPFCQYFFITDKKVTPETCTDCPDEPYQASDYQEFGPMKVWVMQPLQASAVLPDPTKEEKDIFFAPPKLPGEAEIVPADWEDDEAGGDQSTNKEPRKQERVYWKDVF